jgi:rhamnosyltransferase
MLSHDSSQVESEPQRVEAIIVLYQPDHEILGAMIESLTTQVDRIILVDNTPGQRSGEFQSPHVRHLILGANKGLAFAQNLGVKEALYDEASFVIFFDQDSVVPRDLIETLLEDFTLLQVKAFRVGCVGPRALDLHTGKPYRPILLGRGIVDHRFTKSWHLISSGTLIQTDTFQEIGPFDESLFIDAVDQEWCWRANHKGFSCFVDEALVMPHRPGVGAISLGGLKIRFPAPPRLYYQFRNHLRLLIFYPELTVPRPWIAKRLLALPLKFLFNLCLLPDRKRRLRFMLAGIRDGIRNRGGPCPIGDETREHSSSETI